MGPGRNSQMARNLNKSQLGGVIFGCTKSTMKEGLAKQLFGLPSQHFLYVKNIEPGLPLFLFNYSERNLHGIYEAASSGKMNLDPYAWTENGSDRTKFPAQVQIHLRLQCQALPEYQFKPIIIDNYYSKAHFWFELDHAQASKLMSKFSSLAISTRIFTPKNPPKLNPVMQRLPSNNKREENGASEPPHDFDSIGTSATSDDLLSMEGNNNQVMGPSRVESDEKDLIYMKLKELALNPEFQDANLRTSNVELDHEHHDDDVITLGKMNGAHSFDSLDCTTILAQLLKEMEELKIFKQEQTQRMGSLEKKLAEAECEIQRLVNRCMTLESVSNTSSRLSGDQRLTESPDEFHFNLHDSILLVGGYDGETWLSAFDSFLPSHDVLRSLKPMSSFRSYASVARFKGELYVFGGGTKSVWYDTVESYNALNDEWTPRPPLNREKGSLAGAALNGKIYAVGGGNGVECLSDVEMFDPYVGRWISARSMLEKRFAVAAVELNGALYAVGGYDGNDYLKSAERFDPREHSWTRTGSMNAKRGCQSLVTMNEKLYSVGGYDGTAMVPTVEMYDPRVEKWMTVEPMSEGRGYLSAAVYRGSIYAMGGVKTNEDIVDKIECYKEGEGWHVTSLRAVGKRCFASAIVLERD